MTDTIERMERLHGRAMDAAEQLYRLYGPAAWAGCMERWHQWADRQPGWGA
jgi:hypothetical protein